MMQRPSKKALLTALLLVSAPLAHAIVFTEKKTHLAPRDSGKNAAMEFTTWHLHGHGHHPENQRTHLQMVPFFQDSRRYQDVGRYFGVGNSKNTFAIGNPAAPILAPLTAVADLDGSLILHNTAGAVVANDNRSSSVTLKPRQRAFGTRIDLIQDIGHPHPEKGFFFGLSTTAVHIANEMHMALSTQAPAQVSKMTAVAATVPLSFTDFFAGNVDENAQQDALFYGCIDGRRTAAGFADIDVKFGRTLVANHRSHASLALNVTVPTGNRVKSDYLFEPIYGNGRHVGLGFDLDATHMIWEHDNGSLTLAGAVHYTYQLANNEMRIIPPGVASNGSAEPWSQYYLVGKVGAPIGTKAVPGANITTVPVMIRPGHQFNALMAVSFRSGMYTIDAGYDLFWKNAEGGSLNRFDNDGLYTRIANNLNLQTTAVPAGNAITKAQLQQNLSAVLTPSLTTHKLFAGLSFTNEIYKKHAMSVGFGASYEFATSNADLENYALWSKLGFSF